MQHLWSQDKAGLYSCPISQCLCLSSHDWPEPTLTKPLSLPSSVLGFTFCRAHIFSFVYSVFLPDWNEDSIKHTCPCRFCSLSAACRKHVWQKHRETEQTATHSLMELVERRSESAGRSSHTTSTSPRWTEARLTCEQRSWNAEPRGFRWHETKPWCWDNLQDS